MKHLLSILLLPLLAFSSQSSAKPDSSDKVYEKGSTVKTFTSKDKMDVDYKFEKGTKFLLISFDMKTGKMANKILTEKGADYLPNKKAVYIANIYGMPGIGRVFALPKMKKYTHPIILADEKGLLDVFPSSKGKVTVLKLNSSAKILSIQFWDPKTEAIDSILK